jgi:hypothetical protein
MINFNGEKLKLINKTVPEFSNELSRFDSKYTLRQRI